MKQTRGKSTQEGKFVVADARYSGHLTTIAGEPPVEAKEEPTAMSKEEVFDMHWSPRYSGRCACCREWSLQSTAPLATVRRGKPSPFLAILG